MPLSDDLTIHLLHLEQQLLQPAIRRDRASLEALLTADFIEFGSSGRTFDRAAIIAALAAEASAPMLSITDLRVVAAVDDLAVITYRTFGSRPSLRSSTWVLRDSRWQMRFHQGTTEPA